MDTLRSRFKKKPQHRLWCEFLSQRVSSEGGIHNTLFLWNPHLPSSAIRMPPGNRSVSKGWEGEREKERSGAINERKGVRSYENWVVLFLYRAAAGRAAQTDKTLPSPNSRSKVWVRAVTPATACSQVSPQTEHHHLLQAGLFRPKAFFKWHLLADWFLRNNPKTEYQHFYLNA